LRTEGLAPQFLPLDVGEDESVDACAATVAQRHGGVDVLISNAGARISPDRPLSDQVAEFVNVNNLGTTRVLEAFEPLLRPRARVVVVASSFGSLRRLDPALHPLFDGPSLTLEAIDRTMLDYAGAVLAGEAVSAGWPDWINVPSKVGQVASMRIFARRMAADPREMVVNASCPGLVDTEASRPWFADMSQAQSPSEAARDVAWLATAPTRQSGPCGELVQHRRIIPWL
jgi:NAD(P)-dependent dehydrogenase (short-subunit alcohol dehydrogenase family)